MEGVKMGELKKEEVKGKEEDKRVKKGKKDKKGVKDLASVLSIVGVITVLSTGLLGYLYNEMGEKESEIKNLKASIAVVKLEQENKENNVISKEENVAKGIKKVEEEEARLKEEYSKKEKALKEREAKVKSEKKDLDRRAEELKGREADLDKAEARKDKVVKKEASKEEKYVVFMDSMLQSKGDSEMYNAIVKVSSEMKELSKDSDKIEDKGYKKAVIKATDELLYVGQKVLDKNIDEVPSKHKTSFVKFRTAVGLYMSGSKDLQRGVKKKDTGIYSEGASKISDGAKQYQIGISLYDAELSD